MNYLVTGGAGFIGSHLCELLSENNYQIVIIDDFSTGLKSNIDFIKNITLINNKVQNIQVNELPQIDGIFHLAAQASVPVSIDDFYESSANNLLSSIQIFDWAKKLSVPVIYASSSAIYGNLSKGDDQKEDCEILSPYAQDKLPLEHYAKMCWDIYKIPSVGLRFFNVYGPRQDPTNPYSGVISIFIDRLLNNKSVQVNGGYQTRDFIYVKDVVKVISKSMNFLSKNSICEVVNVGTEISTTINKLLTNLSKLTKIEPEVIFNKLPIGDPEKSSGTYEKLNKILDIDLTEFTPMMQGLEKTIEYFRNELSK